MATRAVARSGFWKRIVLPEDGVLDKNYLNEWKGKWLLVDGGGMRT